mmetsp:Transcript_9733/g.14672  ORF Transcript_9733/g.14672 Transcript_9733/m.14672 type:complete len:208 (-) Transcript_9733:617-1240(-)
MPDAVSALRPWRTLVEELRLTGAKPISSSISKSKSPSESHDPLTIDPSPELHWSGSSSENGSDPSEKFCPPIGWRRSVIVSDASVVFLSSSLAAASNDCTGAPALPLPLLAESALDFFERLPRDFFILPRDLRSGFFFFCCMLSTTGSDTPGAHSINFSTHWVFSSPVGKEIDKITAPPAWLCHSISMASPGASAACLEMLCTAVTS